MLRECHSLIKINIAIAIGKLPLYLTTVQFISSAINGFGPVMLKFLQVVADDAEGNLKTVLANVKSSVAPMSSMDTFVMLKYVFKDVSNIVFQQISSSKAAGSLTQGHPAVLSDGSRVFLKVLRRHVNVLLKMDGNLLVEASHDMNNKNLESTFSEVIEDIQKETDFSVERDNLHKMLPVEKSLPPGIKHVKERVKLPGEVRLQPILPILILEHAPGVPLSNIAADDLRVTPAVACDLLGKLKALYKANMQALMMTSKLPNGVAHADMHAGNLLVDLLPTQGTSHITVIKFDSIVELDRKEQKMLMSFGLALYYGHYGNLVNLLGAPEALQDPQKKKEMLKVIIDICKSKLADSKKLTKSERLEYILDVLSKELINRNDFEVKPAFRKVWRAHKLLLDLATKFKAKFSKRLVECPIKTNQWLLDNVLAGMSHMGSTVPMASSIFKERISDYAKTKYKTIMSP